MTHPLRRPRRRAIGRAPRRCRWHWAARWSAARYSCHCAGPSTHRCAPTAVSRRRAAARAAATWWFRCACGLCRCAAPVPQRVGRSPLRPWPQESLCSDFSASVYMMGHLDLALPLDIDRVRLSCGDDRALDPCNTHAHSRSKWDLGVSGIGRLGGAVSGTLSRTLTAGPDRPRRCDANASLRAGLPLCASGRGGQQGKARPCVACHTRAGRAVAPCHHSRAAAQEVSWGGRRRRDRLCRASRDADAQARLAAAEAGVRARGRQPALHAAGSGRRRRDAPRVQAQVRPAMRALARGRSGRGALVH